MKRQPSIQQMTWFLDLFHTKQLDLNPAYQRKSVWTPKDRRFFLDSIFRNYPCPPIFLHKTIRDDDGFTEYHVVDGKQRLETILMFADNKLALDKDFGDINFNNKKFKDLEVNQKRLFWDYVFTVEYLDINDEEDVNRVFDRVNRNARNLQQQELRHARFSGWFITEVEQESEEVFWEDVKISTKARIRRMKNIQFISELMLVIIDSKISGFDQDYLDDKTAELEYLEEEEASFDLDSYRSSKNFCKDYIKKIEEANSSITKYAKTFSNFYSIWSLIVLYKDKNLPPDPFVFATKYSEFMERVNQINAGTGDQSELNNYHAEQMYADNLKGASTDLPQRQNRLDSLLSICE